MQSKEKKNTAKEIQKSKSTFSGTSSAGAAAEGRRPKGHKPSKLNLQKKKNIHQATSGSFRFVETGMMGGSVRKYKRFVSVFVRIGSVRFGSFFLI